MLLVDSDIGGKGTLTREETEVPGGNLCETNALTSTLPEFLKFPPRALQSRSSLEKSNTEKDIV